MDSFDAALASGRRRDLLHLRHQGGWQLVVLGSRILGSTRRWRHTGPRHAGPGRLEPQLASTGGRWQPRVRQPSRWQPMVLGVEHQRPARHRYRGAGRPDSCSGRRPMAGGGSRLLPQLRARGRGRPVVLGIERQRPARDGDHHEHHSGGDAHGQACGNAPAVFDVPNADRRLSTSWSTETCRTAAPTRRAAPPVWRDSTVSPPA